MCIVIKPDDYMYLYWIVRFLTPICFVTAGEREVATEGKLLLLGSENSTLQGFGLQSRKKVKR